MKRLSLLLATLVATACGDWLTPAGPLAFPTPGRGDLVVLSASPLGSSEGELSGVSGLENDLVQAFAKELGVEAKVRQISPSDIANSLTNRRYHLAIGWFSDTDDPTMQSSLPLFSSRDVLIQNEGSLPLTNVSQLEDKTVHVMAGSRQSRTMRQLAEKIPGLKVVEFSKGDILDLIGMLGDGRVEYIAMDDRLDELAAQFVPTFRTTLVLSKAQPIVWLLGNQPNPELVARVNAFIERTKHDGTMARLEERYFGHIRRLEQADVVKFLGAIETMLPKFRKYFTTAQTITGLDWRLLAALAYHESHWDPNAVSYTNVRGIMMLTEDTADELNVSNRLDPAESILAGARYLDQLKSSLPENISEPDRTWLALAAYNLGLGHLNAARSIARQLKANANTWYDMRRVLPLLSKPEYYSKLKSGPGRGGEAVILVENIRSYYDILTRHETTSQKPAGHTGLKATQKGAGGIRQGASPGLILGGQ